MLHRLAPLRTRAGLLAVFTLLLLCVSVVPVLAAAPPEDPQQELPEGPDSAQLPGPADLAAASEKLEREEAEREEWLASPAAQQQRQASLDAFGDVSAAQAQELFASSFGAQIEALDSDPARFLSDAQLVSPSKDETVATVKDEGDTTLMDSPIPVRTENEEGELKKVDLTLEPTADGFETSNALIDVSVPSSASDPIEVGEAGITQQGTSSSPQARRFGDEDVFYPDVLADTDLLVSPTSGGVEIFNQLRSQESPEILHFALDLPAGAELRPDRFGGAEVHRGEETLGYVRFPTAADAQGTQVPIDLQVDGDSLSLTVKHRGADFAYPILVDPEFVWENWYTANWWNGSGLAALTDGTWQQYVNNGTMILQTTPYYSTFGGSNRGLFLHSNSGGWGANQVAQWNYTVPDWDSYIDHASLLPFWRDDHGCGYQTYPQPYDYDGLWDGSQYIQFRTNEARELGYSNLPMWGKVLALGISSGPGGWNPCARDVYVGGVGVWLDDWAPPYFESITGIPSGWVSDETPFAITARGSDIGLGVQNVTLLPEGTNSIAHTLVQNQCVGTVGFRCPATYTATFANDKAGLFLEGERTDNYLTIKDPTAETATSAKFTMRVDRTPPEITLNGQLAQATNEVGPSEVPAGTGDQLRLPVYNLQITATDGNPANPLTKRSGVREIEVLLDGKPQASQWEPAPPCFSSGCPATMTRTYSLALSTLTTAGKHQLEVVAIDLVGKKLKRTVEFEYFPATGMKDEYVMQYFPLPDGEGNEAEEEHPKRPELAVNVMNGNLVYRETDVDVESTAALDLEVERYYNSMLPDSADSEWGDGWTLSQTPDLNPVKVGGSPVVNQADILDTSSVMEGEIGLPTAVGASKFDPALQATVTKEPDGGFELTDETGESEGSVVFDASGRTESLQSDGYAEVDYDYEGGDLSEISVEDPATFTADPEDLEIEEPEPISAPVFSSSFGSNGTGNGQMKAPADVAVDLQGNFWMVDKSNNRIQKFSSSGVYVLKFGSLGSANGQFNRPTAIAIAANGDLLVADSGNSRIQRFTAGGAFVSKFGTKGTGNGQFTGTGPEGIAVDSSGSIWVADTYAGRIQKFNSAGEFIKAVGTKGTGSGQLGEPVGIDVDSSGNAWVAERQNNRVSVFNSAGEFVKQFGSPGSGDGQLKQPEGIDVDELGNVWVADRTNNRIEQFDLTGTYKAKFGSLGAGQDQFNFALPMGLATDSKGHLWVADVNNNRIQQWLVPIERPAYASAFGSTGSGDGQFKAPADVAVGLSGSLWVVDKTNNRIQKFSGSGKYISKFGTLGSADGQFNRPTAIAVDRDGNLLVVDADNNRIQKFDPNGQFLSKFGSAGTGNGQLSSPEGITADFKGNIWVADSGNGRLQKFDEDGKFIAVVSSKGAGTGQLGKPTGIDVDPEGRIWVADWQNNRISVFDGAGQFVNQYGSAGSGNGQFNRPDTIEVDPRGNVWVGDQENGRVQRFDLEGGYVGQFGAKGTTEAKFAFAYPMGIAADKTGHIWVTDVANNRIQQWLLGNYPPAPEIELNGDDDPRVELETDAGLVSSIEGGEAGTHTYDYEGDFLVSHEGPEGETVYEKDASDRLTKVTLPNGTWGSIVYWTDGRVKSVTVDPAGSAPPKTTTFSYSDEPRRTVVTPPDAPHITYDIGPDGSVFKWWHKQQPPSFLDISGSLWVGRGGTISTGDHTLYVKTESTEGIASIQIIANGSTLVEEKTCAQEECPTLTLPWVINTGDFAPGILNLELLVTDDIGQTESERFWVDVPFTPPPVPGAPVAPRFKDILRFHEEYGMEIVFPVASEAEFNERIFNLINAWHMPDTAAGKVARSSWDRWGVPMNPQEVAEMEYRERYLKTNGPLIEEWANAHQPTTYAGYYMDHGAGGVLRVGFTSGGMSALPELIANAGVEGADRFSNFPGAAPAYSYGQLVSAEELVWTAVEGNTPLATLINEVSIDQTSNRVVVETADIAKGSELLSQSGALSPSIVLVHSDLPPYTSGRFRTSGPMYAGDAIRNSSGGCTGGFGAVERMEYAGTIIRPASRFLLTAGHCFDIGESIYRSTDVLGEPFNKDHSQRIGHIGRNALETSELIDVAAVKLVNDLAPRRIYGEGGNLPIVGPVGEAYPGERLCFSGARSRQVLCGDVKRIRIKRFERGKPSGVVIVRIEKPPGSLHGDSGSPVWSPATGESIGILSAGDPDTQLIYVAPLIRTKLDAKRSVPGALELPEMSGLMIVQGH